MTGPASQRDDYHAKLMPVELLIAHNPDPESRLAYLLRLPLGSGMVFRTSGTWPRTKALYCYPVEPTEWPEDPEIVEQVPVRSCVRRGAAIDLVLDRSRENRSQLVFTTARGRDAVFWQSPRTRKQARPDVRTPTARAAGIAELQIVVDSHHRYLAAAQTWAATEPAALERIGIATGELDNAPTAPEPATAEVRAWARADGVPVPARGKLRPEVWDSWRAAHP
ncbi:MAG: Lsr2 family DNA-binding protein [Pseudonocardiaceae bacterium]